MSKWDGAKGWQQGLIYHIFIVQGFVCNSGDSTGVQFVFNPNHYVLSEQSIWKVNKTPHTLARTSPREFPLQIFPSSGPFPLSCSQDSKRISAQLRRRNWISGASRWMITWSYSWKKLRGTTTLFWARRCRRSGGPHSLTSTEDGSATTLVAPCSTCYPGSCGASISTTWSAMSIFPKASVYTCFLSIRPFVLIMRGSISPKSDCMLNFSSFDIGIGFFSVIRHVLSSITTPFHRNFLTVLLKYMYGCVKGLDELCLCVKFISGHIVVVL